VNDVSASAAGDVGDLFVHLTDVVLAEGVFDLRLAIHRGAQIAAQRLGGRILLRLLGHRLRDGIIDSGSAADHHEPEYCRDE
jgi:hypothetical protein